MHSSLSQILERKPMAIFGSINDIVKNVHFNKRIVDGLDYIAALTSDAFSGLKEGDSQKISLDGDRLFALNQIYKTRPVDQAKFEGHRKYIDLQYVFEGIETIRYSSLSDCRPQSDYEEKNDVQFFTSDFFTPIAMKAGSVCILYPEDIHAPGVLLDTRGIVKKSVVKVLI